jgi:hypothetical protein
LVVVQFVYGVAGIDGINMAVAVDHKAGGRVSYGISTEKTAEWKEQHAPD